MLVLQDNFGDKVKQDAKFLGELCLYDEQMFCYEQSKIAATCLMLALQRRENGVNLSVSNLQKKNNLLMKLYFFNT